ncbi:MAG: hypothetical protein WAT70_07975 [Rhizobiaceae bacterium]
MLALGLLFLVLALIAAPPARADAASRYEKGWPDVLSTLRLDADRDYVAIILIPPAGPLDARDGETMRRSLLPYLAEQTRLGHTVIAWQCGGRRGMVSQSGEHRLQGTRMAFSGWGLAATLSTFNDGALRGENSLRPAYARVLAEGRGHIVAVETDSAHCNAMKAFLSRYITHPNRPASRFSLLLDPERFEGGGCASFALALAEKAGIAAGLKRHLRRTSLVHEAALGRLDTWPDLTTPFTVGGDHGRRRIPVGRLLSGPLDTGKVLARVRFVDPELLLAALSGARQAAGERRGFLQDRVLPSDDPAVRAAVDAGRAWARRPARIRLVDRGRLNALVLERR